MSSAKALDAPKRKTAVSGEARELLDIPAAYLKQDGTLNYDAFHDEEVEVPIAMDNHGSVVTHLLSQVKIGMDLTKITLPTFILETRSLLEMFADYFSHPDMFVKISELKSERDRMVQVMRWYICSYHAGRNSEVARKPYNPVLGEFFQCYWEVPGLESYGGLAVNDGPVPWSKEHNLAFVAEQVSHHPPVTAFYAEHPLKRISFNASIWTKSKYLGLSIGVHNIGKGVIHVLDYNEKYVLTFPSGYGRSILTVPWIELGGQVSISCEETGYKASLEFLTKPFYGGGGKKHRIQGEVYSPGSKEPFLRLKGKWNEAVEAEWSDGRREVWADVRQLSTVRKEVRRIEEQEPLESRRLWREVTAGLRLGDLEYATAKKSNIEQRQRLEAGQRKEADQEWQPRFFTKNTAGEWLYLSPLIDRL